MDPFESMKSIEPSGTPDGSIKISCAGDCGPPPRSHGHGRRGVALIPMLAWCLLFHCWSYSLAGLVALIPLLAWWPSFPCWLLGSYSLAGFAALVRLLTWSLLFPCWLGASYSIVGSYVLVGLVALIPLVAW